MKKDRFKPKGEIETKVYQDLHCKEFYAGSVEASGYITGKKVGVFAYLESPASTTIVTAGTYEYIRGTFVNDPIEDFTTVATPAIRYDGDKTQYFEIDWHAEIEANFTNTDVEIAFKKNGVVCQCSPMKTRCFTPNAPYSISGTAVIELSTNDEIQLVVTSDGSGDVITFDNFTTTITEFFD